MNESESDVLDPQSDCNLFSFSLQRGPQRNGLEKDGVYHIDDVVNKLIKGTLSSIVQAGHPRLTAHIPLGALSSADVSQDQAVKAGHVFFTSTGRIGAILEMNDAMSLHMTALQRNMAKSLIGPGGVNHTKYVFFLVMVCVYLY